MINVGSSVNHSVCMESLYLNVSHDQDSNMQQKTTAVASVYGTHAHMPHS